ncbi:MAG: hypothetical protein COA44_03175 [Arcobacter sp.]|nr:MAG: hypothetical protein COA44_03175 [Arcobacter sp.]
MKESKGFIMKGKLFNCSNGATSSEHCFVIADGGKHGYFVSSKKADGPLMNGACISFELEDQKKGSIVTDVHILD